MISKTQDYRDAITGDARRIHLKIPITLISPEITYTGYSSSSLLNPNTFDYTETYERDFEVPSTRRATLELNRWVLDEKSSLDDDYIVRFNSRDMVDDSAQWYELTFSNLNVLQAFSVYFSDNVADGVPENFTVELKSAGYTIWSKSYTGNTENSISVEGFTAYNPTALRVTVTKMSVPYRRFRLKTIILGIYEEWTGDNVGTLNIKHQTDVSCASLPYGTCEIGLDNQSRRFDPRNKTGIFSSIEEGQAIPVSIGVELADGTIDYTSIGTYFQHSTGWKTSDNGIIMNWSLVDIIGLLSERNYVIPETLPSTLQGWASSLVSQLGASFANRLTIDPNYADMELRTFDPNDFDDYIFDDDIDDWIDQYYEQITECLKGKTCGDVLQWICQATGTFPRAEALTGNLAIEPLWNSGNYITLDNLVNYPTMKANEDVALITFTIKENQYIISGNNPASDRTINISNPFIHTEEQAIACAKTILSLCGGNEIELLGRGDPSSEIGDVDTIQLDESNATSARRVQQEFSFSDGVMKTLQSRLIQPDGGFLYHSSDVITQDGEWTAPAGVTSIRIILGGGGGGGSNGTNGSYYSAGEAGADGIGGKIFSQTLTINEGQTFAVTIGAGGAIGQSGSPSTFGLYSSEMGRVYNPAFTDSASGNSYGRTGVQLPRENSSDGGIGGKGGRKGNKHKDKTVIINEDGTVEIEEKTVIDNRPGNGTSGVAGASGFCIVYYDNPSS